MVYISSYIKISLYYRWYLLICLMLVQSIGCDSDKATSPGENVVIEGYFDGWPSWSPDGRYIAFSHNALSWDEASRYGQYSIWLYDLQENKYGFFVGPGTFPKWNPDGSILAFNVSNQIYFYYIALRKVRRVTTSGGIFIFNWSDDGSKLITNYSGGCWLIDTLGNFYRNVSPDSTPEFWSTVQGATWVPGRDEIFLSRADATTDISLIIVDTLGTILREIFRLDGGWDFANYPAWSRDGRYFAIYMNGDLGGSFHSELQIRAADGRLMVAMPDVGSQPTWSPDGHSIAYTRRTWMAPSPDSMWYPDLYRINIWLSASSGYLHRELLGWPPEGYDSTLFDGGYRWPEDSLAYFP